MSNVKSFILSGAANKAALFISGIALCTGSIAKLEQIPNPSNTDVIFPYKAKYHIFHDNEKVGKANRSLVVKGNNTATLSTRTKVNIWFITDKRGAKSIMEWNNGKFRSMRLSGDCDSIACRHWDHQQVKFDWDKQKASVKTPERKLNLDVEPGTYDDVNYQLQLRRDFANPDTTKVSYQVLFRKKVKTYEFEKIGEETIVTPFGKIDTIKVKMIRKKRRVTTLWLAKDYDYIVARIRQTLDGEEQADIKLSDYKRI